MTTQIAKQYLTLDQNQNFTKTKYQKKKFTQVDNNIQR